MDVRVFALGVFVVMGLCVLSLASGGCDEVAELVEDEGITGALTDLLDIPDGEYVNESLPDPTGSSDSPVIDDVQSPGTLVNGQSFDYGIDFDDPDGAGTVEDLIIAFAGLDGYFRVPVDSDEGRATVMITVLKLWDDNSMAMSFAARDRDGNVSEYVTREADVIETGAGDVKVTLSFDQDTDVDLHVIEPDGSEIFWHQKESSNGGELDLDSNAGCLWIDGVNVENIYWPEDAAPKGSYTVRVDYYAACVSDPVNYIVTVMVNGEVSTYRGQFTADQADQGGAGSGVTVTTFEY